MGFEDENNSHVVAHYVPIMYSTLLIGVALMFSNIVLINWKRVISVVLFSVAFYIFLRALNSDVINNHFISIFLYEYKCQILVGIIILPIVYQIYVYWLYSSIYKGYLKNKVSTEYDRFHASMNGIKNKEKSKVDKVYLDIWTDTIFKSGEDSTLTPFYEALNNQLLIAASPSHWQLVKSWIIHHINCLSNKSNQNSNIGEDVVKKEIQQSQLEQYENQRAKILDFQKEYDDYCIWKKTAGKNSSLRAYCTANNLPVKDVVAWLRVNKPKKR